MNANNKQLLKKYAEENDQQAFDQLVANLINIAYSASLAYLGQEDLARDVCQLTFLELSKKAGRLSDSVQLGGWVHVTAYNMARKIQRSEIRRQKREQNYVNNMNDSQHKEPDWTKLLPEIHEAMGQLKPKERDAIVLRFFQNKSLADVGVAMNVSTDAARMRVNRALDRLNVQLTRKGIASTAMALAAALPAHALTVAPSGLALSISSSIVAGTGAAIVGTSTIAGAILIIMKTKAFIISTAVAATVLTGTGVYMMSSQDEEVRSSSLSEQSAPVVEKEMVREVTRSEDLVRRSAVSTDVAEAIDTSEIDSFIQEESFDSNNLGIESEYLEKAKALIVSMSKERESINEETLTLLQSESMMKMANDELPDTPKVLALRLGLDSEVAAKFEHVLGTYKSEEVDRVQQGIQRIIDSGQELFDENNEDFCQYMALYIKKEKEGEIPEYQERFAQQFEAELLTSMENDYPLGEDSLEIRDWYESEKVVEALKAELSAEQQEALMITIEEQKNRKRESGAYERSHELANKLGLSEADRSELYGFLYRNPRATNEDIAKELSPELHPLLHGEELPFGAVKINTDLSD